jgi:hypothetical protein
MDWFFAVFKGVKFLTDFENTDIENTDIENTDT